MQGKIKPNATIKQKVGVKYPTQQNSNANLKSKQGAEGIDLKSAGTNKMTNK